MGQIVFTNAQLIVRRAQHVITKMVVVTKVVKKDGTDLIVVNHVSDIVKTVNIVIKPMDDVIEDVLLDILECFARTVMKVFKYFSNVLLLLFGLIFFLF